jgi:hypothetical protein
MTEQQGLTMTALWILVVILYYWMGRLHGYRKGYVKGTIEGAKILLDTLAKYKTDSKVQEDK